MISRFSIIVAAVRTRDTPSANCKFAVSGAGGPPALQAFKLSSFKLGQRVNTSSISAAARAIFASARDVLYIRVHWQIREVAQQSKALGDSEEHDVASGDGSLKNTRPGSLWRNPIKSNQYPILPIRFPFLTAIPLSILTKSAPTQNPAICHPLLPRFQACSTPDATLATHRE